MGDVLWVALATVVTFVLGSLPFAVWLSRFVGHCDVRRVGDGNPGTANAFKGAGWKAGVPVLALDLGKAGVPVGIANWVLGFSTWALVPVALAPIIGHAFSPFLRFRGGKAIAVTFGSWIGLLGWAYALALGVCIGICYAVQRGDAWAVAGGMTVYGAVLLVVGKPLAVLVVWLVNLGILAYKHHGEYSGTLDLRPWVPVFRSRRV